MTYVHVKVGIRHVKVGIRHVKVGLRVDRSTSGSIDFALQVAWRILRLVFLCILF